MAQNLIKWGVGAINVDGCRIAYGDSAWPGPGDVYSAGTGRKSPPSISLSGGLDGSLNVSISSPNNLGRWPANIYHCPKPSRGEREAGDWEGVPGRTGAQAVQRQAGSAGLDSPRAGAGRTAAEVQNHHPTVKPSKLMRWLARLVTPPGGLLLEPFCGSGTTLLAAEREGFRCLAVEREPAYCDIIRARYRGGSQDGSPD